MKKNYIDNIKNYGNEIETITDFVEIVRKRPGMYIGPKGTAGHINMIREVFQNSLDEMVKSDSPCTAISVTYDERDKVICIEDNGRGIPFSSMVRIFTSQHTSSNYTKKEGQFSSGLNGVGAKVTNALSLWFDVHSYILGEGKYVKFNDGKPTKEGIVDIPNKNNLQGTMVRFKPCEKSMGDIHTTVGDVLNLVMLLLPLTQIGAIINFKGIYVDGNETIQSIVNRDGIITNLIIKTQSPLIKPIVISKHTGTMTVDLAFTFDSEHLNEKDITAFANFCPTMQGTHIQGFISGLCNFFRNYMNNIFLTTSSGKKSKTIVINQDVEVGLKAIISVKHLEPEFTGQAKEIFSNGDMKPFIEQTMKEFFNEWVKINPKDTNKLCSYIKGVADIRMRADKDKVKLSNQYSGSALNGGLPKKFIKAGGNKNLELLIFEGDSALQAARNARCTETQALYPVKGKIPNAFSKTKAEFIKNEDVAGIISILGGDHGKSFDLSKVKWSKILIACDADPDGKHIRAGILKFLLLYCRPLVEEGMVYSLVPPLYSISHGNKKHTYLTDRISYVKYVQELFIKENKVVTITDKKLTSEKISSIIMDNLDYTYELEKVANNYAISFELLEMIIMYDNNFNKLKEIVTSNYRFVENISKSKNGREIIYNIKGLINGRYQNIIVNDKLRYECKHLVEYLNNNENIHYKMNGSVVTLYQLMKTFEAYSPKSIQRYKGLGEMNSKQLSESCVHPDSDRVLIQYTSNSILEEIKAIEYMESNKNDFIKNVKVSRFEIQG